MFKEQGVISLWTFFQLVEMVVTSQHDQPSGSSWSGVCVLVANIVNFFNLGSSVSQESSEDMAQNVTCCP